MSTIAHFRQTFGHPAHERSRHYDRRNETAGIAPFCGGGGLVCGRRPGPPNPRSPRDLSTRRSPRSGACSRPPRATWPPAPRRPTCGSRSAARSAATTTRRAGWAMPRPSSTRSWRTSRERMLAIRIKQAPASFPHRDAVAGTWTVIYFTPAGEHDAGAHRRPRLRRLAGLAGDAQILRRGQPLDAGSHREALLAEVQAVREGER